MGNPIWTGKGGGIGRKKASGPEGKEREGVETGGGKKMILDKQYKGGT